MAAAAASAAPAFIGLTGAVAAGKSEALTALERLGAATLSSDAIVHELLAGEGVRRTMVERWGEDVAPGGELDRDRVAAIVFERPQELAWLESALHPLVGGRIATWREGLVPSTRIAVVEVPLLFETGMDSGFDATICVIADDAARGRRAGLRGTEALAQRSARQFSQDEKARRATFVVRNDGGVEDLEAELARLLPVLAAAARADD